MIRAWSPRTLTYLLLRISESVFRGSLWSKITHPGQPGNQPVHSVGAHILEGQKIDRIFHLYLLGLCLGNESLLIGVVSNGMLESGAFLIRFDNVTRLRCDQGKLSPFWGLRDSLTDQ